MRVMAIVMMIGDRIANDAASDGADRASDNPARDRAAHEAGFVSHRRASDSHRGE